MKHILYILFALLFSITAEAQNGQRKEFSPELFKKKLELFITKEVGLTPAEGQRFFPLLHEMFEKQRKNNDKGRDLMRNVGENASETAYETVLEQSSALEIENKKIEKQYLKKFHSVLSWKKVYKVRRALIRFQIEALKRFSPPPQHEPGNREHRQWNWRKSTKSSIQEP